MKKSLRASPDPKWRVYKIQKNYREERDFVDDVSQRPDRLSSRTGRELITPRLIASDESRRKAPDKVEEGGRVRKLTRQERTIGVKGSAKRWYFYYHQRAALISKMSEGEKHPEYKKELEALAIGYEGLSERIASSISETEMPRRARAGWHNPKMRRILPEPGPRGPQRSDFEEWQQHSTGALSSSAESTKSSSAVPLTQRIVPPANRKRPIDWATHEQRTSAMAAETERMMKEGMQDRSNRRTEYEE